MRRATFALLIALVAAFAVAACGGEDSAEVPTKAEFKQTYQGLVDELVVVGADVGKAVNEASGKSNKKLESTFSDLSERTQKMADKFEDATPPDDPVIQQNMTKLVAGLNLAADDLEAIAAAAKKNDIPAAAAAAAKLTQDNEQVAAPRIALDEAVLGVKPPATTTAATGSKTTTGK